MIAGMPITAYLNSKHGLEGFRSRTKKDSCMIDNLQLADLDSKIKVLERNIKAPSLQLSCVESQVKSNNLLTVANLEEIKKSKACIQTLTCRVDSCSSEVDRLSQDFKLTQKEFSDIKKGTKRKWDEINQFSVEVDAQFDSFLNQITDLQTSIGDLSLQIQEIQTNQKRTRYSWIKSAAIGASAAIVVVAGVILSPEL